jgi:Helix-hairpin-helix domain
MSDLDLDDTVQARLARILDAKRRDNADILSALRVAEDAWERLNKEVDTAIGQEFDLISSEQAAVLAARDRLDNPNTDPVDKSFVFAGRVFDAATKTGLPQITVRVLRDRDSGEPLATAITDAAGAYRAIIPPDQFDPSDEATPIRIEALAAGAARPVALQRHPVVLTSGGVEQVDLPVEQSRAVGANVAAGESARDSLEATIETVKQRLESMQAAHTATTRFADLTRDGLKELSAAMASDPPPIEPGLPPAPEPGPAPAPGPEPEPQPTSTPLEKIPGVGERIAAKLRDAGIPDCEALVATDFDKVVEILGPALAKRAVASARKLLKNG